MTIEDKLIQIDEKQDKLLILMKDLKDNGGVNNKDKVYDLTDLEEILHVSRRTLFKWKSEEKMNFSQIGKKIFITDAELKRFLSINKSE